MYHFWNTFYQWWTMVRRRFCLFCEWKWTPRLSYFTVDNMNGLMPSPY
jgi:hypothetical protein